MLGTKVQSEVCGLWSDFGFGSGEHVECCESSERPWTGQFHEVVNLVNISCTAANREHSPG